MTAPFNSLQLVLQSPSGGAFLRIPLPSLVEDPTGDERTERTVAAMVAVVQSTQRTGIARAATKTICGSIMTTITPTERALRIYQALVKLVSFETDPAKLEYLRHPDVYLYDLAFKGSATVTRSFKHTGDCDDMAMMGAALLLAAGLRPVLICQAVRPAPYDRFAHVIFGYIDDQGKVVPLDPQEKLAPGTMAPMTRAKVWEVRPSVAFTFKDDQ